MHRSLLTTFGILALAGCANSMRPPAPPEARAATVVSASFGKTWDAVIDAFASRAISIETLDRSSGLIVPAGRTYVATDVAEALSYADCGTNWMGQPVPAGTVKYNVVVRGDSSQSTVQVRAFYASSTLGSGCTSRGLFETQTEGAIKAAAEGRSLSPGELAASAPCTSTAETDQRDWHVTLRKRTLTACTETPCTIRGAGRRGSPSDAIALCETDHSFWDKH